MKYTLNILVVTLSSLASTALGQWGTRIDPTTDDQYLRAPNGATEAISTGDHGLSLPGADALIAYDVWWDETPSSATSAAPVGGSIKPYSINDCVSGTAVLPSGSSFHDWTHSDGTLDNYICTVGWSTSSTSDYNTTTFSSGPGSNAMTYTAAFLSGSVLTLDSFYLEHGIVNEGPYSPESWELYVWREDSNGVSLVGGAPYASWVAGSASSNANISNTGSGVVYAAGSDYATDVWALDFDLAGLGVNGETLSEDTQFHLAVYGHGDQGTVPLSTAGVRRGVTAFGDAAVHGILDHGVVPEPSASLLSILGITGLVLLRRRR